MTIGKHRTALNRTMHRVIACYDRGVPSKFEDFKIHDLDNSLTSINTFFFFLKRKKIYSITCFVPPIQHTLRASHACWDFYMEVINVHPLVLLGVISRKSTYLVPFLNMKKMSIQTLVCDRNVWVIIWTDSKFKKSFMVRGEFHCNWNVFGSGRIRLCNYSLCVQTSGLVVLPSVKRIPTYPTFSFRFDQRLILKQGKNTY